MDVLCVPFLDLLTDRLLVAVLFAALLLVLMLLCPAGYAVEPLLPSLPVYLPALRTL